MWTAIATGLGILSTLLAWYLNPSTRKAKELVSIINELEEAYKERDRALENNDHNALTAVLFRISVLRKRKDALL